MNVFSIFHVVISALFILCFAYQFFYLIISLVHKPIRFEKGDLNHFAVLIAARNEEAVIGNLIDSIKAQTYNSHLTDIYVVADNCTDATAEIAARHGAIVYTRQSEQKGKGYALDFLLQKIRKRYGFDLYDGYFVFDADNLLDPHFIEEMNKVFSAGYKIVTSYRNSKNYGTNWITSGYALWFLHEARHLNCPRMMLHTSCTISGTGFLMHRDIVKKFDGWKQHLLVEDIQFSAENILDGEMIGYCEDAVIYDEQPETFRVSWNQRLRWIRGHLQIVGHYGLRLIRGLCGPNFTSCYDFLMNIFPAMFLAILGFLTGLGQMIYAIITLTATPLSIIQPICSAFFSSYSMFFFIGLLTTLTERKHIRANASRKLTYLFTFPFFMFTYIPITIASIFQKVEWKPIRHTVAVTLDEIDSK